MATGLLSILALAVAVQQEQQPSRDPGSDPLCQDIFAIFDARSNKFSALRGAFRTDDNSWAPTLLLPGASCRITDEGNRAFYSCKWQMDVSPEAHAKFLTMMRVTRWCLSAKGISPKSWVRGGSPGEVFAVQDMEKGLTVDTKLSRARTITIATWRMGTFKPVSHADWGEDFGVDDK